MVFSSRKSMSQGTLSLMQISFGTSGHRGIIGESFTVAHISAIAAAVAMVLREQRQPLTLAIGFDPREGNCPDLTPGSYTAALVDRLVAMGVDVVLSESFCATPVISWAVPTFGFGGGFMLTASHNPPNYNGVKFNVASGAPAPQAVTSRIQELGNAILSGALAWELADQKGTVSRQSFIAPFVAALRERVAAFWPLGSAAVAVDARHGTAGQVWAEISRQFGHRVTVALADPRADFGQLEPNPTAGGVLTELGERVVRDSIDFGVAHDPDSDRFVIVDDTGQVVSAEVICSIILDQLCRAGASVYGVATTVASSGLVAAVANHHKVRFEETVVGFKHFSGFFDDARAASQVGLAVESSGGFSISTHVYEKCGFLPAVMVAAIVSHTGKSVSVLMDELVAQYPPFHFVERSFTVSAEAMATLRSQIADSDREWPLEGVVAVNRADGLKLMTNTGWVLCRLSGTEPVVRVYAESESEAAAMRLLQGFVDVNLNFSKG